MKDHLSPRIKCPNCGSLMITTVEAEMGQEYKCVDCDEQIEIYF